MDLLDVRTIIAGYILTNALCAGVMALLWRQNRQRFAGLGFWLADFVVQWVAVVLVALRGSVPDFVAMVVSNTLLVAGGLLLLIGLERFVGKPGPQTHNYLLLAAFLAVHTYFLYVHPSLAARNIDLSVGLLVMCFQGAWLLRRRVDPGLRSITPGASYVLAAYCLVSLGRIGVELIAPSSTDLFQTGLSNAVPLLIYQLLLIGLTFSLFLMVNRRLSGEIQRSATTLRENEQLLQTILDHTPTYVAYIDQNRCYRFVNQRYAENFGLPLAAMVGRPYRDIVGEAYYQASVKNLDAAFAGQSLSFEAKIDLPIPGPRWLIVSYAPDEEAPGEVKGVFVVGFDITERVRSEQERQQAEAEIRRLNENLELRIAARTAELEKASQELRASEEKYRTVADFTYDWEYWLGPDGQYLYVSPACERITGYRPEEFQNDPTLLEAITHPDDRALLAQHLHSAESASAPRALDFRILTRSGETRWIGHRCQPVHSAAGDYQGQRGSNRDINARKQAEAALQENERRLQSIIDRTGAGYFRIGADGRFQAVNTAWLQMHGYASPDEVIGRHFSLTQVDADLEQAQSNVQHLLKGMPILAGEFPRRCKDGSIGYHTFSAAPVMQGGEIIGLDGFLIDTSARVRSEQERRRMEAELRESEAKYRTLVETTDTGYVIVDSEGRVLEANPEYLRLTGRNSLAELQGQSVAAWTAPHDLARNVAAVRDCLQVGFVRNLEIDCVDRQGRLRPIEINAAALPGPGGDRIVALCRDITERKQAEAALRESDAKYHALFSEMMNGCALHEILCSPAGQPVDYVTLEVNKAYEVLLGVRQADVTGQRASAVLPPEELEKWLGIFGPVALTGQSARYEMYSPLNQKYFEGSAYSPVGGKFAVTFADVTDRVRSEQERRQAEAVLRDSEARYRELATENARLLELSQADAAAKAILLHEVNHRVKNNLSAIIGLLYLEQQYLHADDQAPFRALVQELTGRIGSLATVHGLLSASTWAPIRLTDLAETVIREALAMLPRQRSVQVEVSPSPVRLAPKQANALALILNELATNTLKHAANETHPTCLRVQVSQADDEVCVEFRDDGPGFPEAILRGERRSVGLHLIETLTKGDLLGTVTLGNDQGAVVWLRFTAADDRTSQPAFSAPTAHGV